MSDQNTDNRSDMSRAMRRALDVLGFIVWLPLAIAWLIVRAIAGFFSAFP